MESNITDFRVLHSERSHENRASPRRIVVVIGLASAVTLICITFLAEILAPQMPEEELVSVANATLMEEPANVAGLFKTLDFCGTVTEGTCTLFPCAKFRGEVQCIGGSCICKPGYCSNAFGICQDPNAPKCKADTGGTCKIFGCSSWRGPTQCVNGKCLCEDGFCSTGFSGMCKAKGTCIKDTAGTCRVGSCKETRGQTECIDGKCICPTGYCAQDNGAGYGVCMLQKHPGYLAKVEAVNKDQPVFPGAHNKVVRALAFSGGGARALSNTMGAYRALEDLGLMQYIDGISSVSGGTWASSIYMFAHLSKSELLGEPTIPESLTLDALSNKPPALGAAVTRSCHDFVKHMLAHDLPSDQIWPLFIGSTILKPFGLDSTDTFMAASSEDVERIKTENPQIAQQPFYTPVPGRPKVFVMGGTLLSPRGYKSGPRSAVSLQMSPDYVGSPFYPDGVKVNYEPSNIGARVPLQDVIVGGGFVETFAFGGNAPKDGQSGGGRADLPPPAKPFTLAEAVGISSVAPAAGLAAEGKYQYIVPEAKVWPVTDEKQEALVFELGDGGNLENSGLLALLQRNARQIAMWVSTYIPLSADIDFCNLPDYIDLQKVFTDTVNFAVAPMVSDKFGFPYQDAGDYYTNNQVFAQDGLPKLLCELQTLKKAGKPAVHRSTQTVLPNSWWGIAGGYDVDLLMVYLDQSTDFENSLPEDTRSKLGPADASDRTWKTSGEFARFPHYKTTRQTEETAEITRLTGPEVNLLAAQSEYAVRQNKKLFREVFCPHGLSGLCCRHPDVIGCGR